MGKLFEGIEGKLEEFIARQHMFFVATAPLAGDGLVNLSPKGLDTFRILDLRTVAYLDLTGSGIETLAHLKENRRIVIMFCAFEGPPKIVRLHGEGEAIEPGHAEFEELVARFPPHEGTRSVIRVHCRRISDSCGFGVPLLAFQGHRTLIPAWAERKGPEEIREYQEAENARSLDGLPGLDL
ncbi:MAG: pyridoxamine 5'-phosphate oxidase family protein [bacterium]|nr:pyridoxamine 5'-phosphate oxidase family protein [bacterium]